MCLRSAQIVFGTTINWLAINSRIISSILLGLVVVTIPKYILTFNT